MNKFLFYVILLLFLQFVGCNSDRTSLDNTHLGGCILIDSVADLPSDIYQMTSITETNEYPSPYCGHRWCENQNCLERADKIWPAIVTFVKYLVKLPKSKQPGNGKPK